MFSLRPPEEMVVLGERADIGTGNETGVGVEVGRDVLVQRLVAEAAAIAAQHTFMILHESVTHGGGRNRGAGTAGCIERGNNFAGGVSGGNRAAKPRCPVLTEAEGSVDAAHPVEVAVVFAVDIDCANAALLAKVVANAAHHEVSAGSAKQGVVGNEQAGRTIVGDKETQIPRALLPCQARSKTGLDHAVMTENHSL